MITILVASAIILAGAALAVRRVDIRLVLAASAFALFALAGDLAEFFVIFAREMANDKTVVPICSAMGFAHVVKMTGCDQHLIHLLTAPLRWVRPLLVPGGIAVGFLVNTAIVSQSSTAATVGPVLIPLIVAAGISLPTAGAMLLLGASVGGELFNPGAVEIVTLSTLTGLAQTEIVRRVAPYDLIAAGTATLVFWRLSVVWERRAAARADEPAAPVPSREETAPEPFRINAAKALVPLVPLALLFLLPAAEALPAALKGGIMIGAAMLAGTALAGLTAPASARRLATSFFEGAGFAYAHVISLIVTATLFTEAIKANGLIELLAAGLSTQPALATATSVALPGLLAAVSGSGIAPAVAVMNVLVPMAGAMSLDPVRVGALCSVAAQLGRTMSPAAAVVMMSAAVSGVPPHELLKRVVVPLLAGAAAMLAAALAGVV